MRIIACRVQRLSKINSQIWLKPSIGMRLARNASKCSKLNHREYAGDLFYHAFQDNPAINYEHFFFSRVAPGSSINGRSGSKKNSKPALLKTRYLTAVWNLDCDWKLDLSLELTREFKPDELNGTSEPAIFRVEAEFNAKVQPNQARKW